MIFLLLQKRIFGSYYWEHIVAELGCQTKLANQGAALFKEISSERIEEAKKREDETVRKITESLQRIEKQQSNVKDAAAFVETSDHFEGLFRKAKTNNQDLECF